MPSLNFAECHLIAILTGVAILEAQHIFAFQKALSKVAYDSVASLLPASCDLGTGTPARSAYMQQAPLGVTPHFLGHYQELAPF